MSGYLMVEDTLEYVLKCIESGECKCVDWDDEKNIYYIRLAERCCVYYVEEDLFVNYDIKDMNHDKFKYNSDTSEIEIDWSVFTYDDVFVYPMLYNMISNEMGACLEEYAKLMNDIANVVDYDTRLFNDDKMLTLFGSGGINKDQYISARRGMFDLKAGGVLEDIKFLGMLLDKIHDHCYERYGVSPNNVDKVI